MASEERWYFTKEQLANSPSRKQGIDADKELSYRQQAAHFIQDMGQRLAVSQLCINTAIVYMHRFFVCHSLRQFHRYSIATASLFLAAKTEEQPRKLEHVIKMASVCLHRDQVPPDTRSEQFIKQTQDLVFHENVLLQTLGFDFAIDHPHTHVVRCCELVKASKDLAKTSYFMASNSLRLTTMCLQYKPTVVACFCIHLACKWSNWEIPQSNEGKHWFWYVDKSVTSELLEHLTKEFQHVFDKKKIMSISANQSSPNSSNNQPITNSPFNSEPHKVLSPATGNAMFDCKPSTSHSSRQHHSQDKQEKSEDKKAVVASSSSSSRLTLREYRERREREKAASASAQGHVTDPSKHHKLVANATSVPNKHQLQSVQKSSVHHNHHHRPDMKVSQPISQRHSAGGSQAREASRDPSRQRLPREYNVGANTSVANPARNVNLDVKSQVPQKGTPARGSVHNQHSAYGVSQILKDSIGKNGSSQACLSTLKNVDESRPEKRPRIAHDDADKSFPDMPHRRRRHPPSEASG